MDDIVFLEPGSKLLLKRGQPRDWKALLLVQHLATYAGEETTGRVSESWPQKFNALAAAQGLR